MLRQASFREWSHQAAPGITLASWQFDHSTIRQAGGLLLPAPNTSFTFSLPIIPVHLPHHAAAQRLQQSFPGPHVHNISCGLQRCRWAWSAPSTMATAFSDPNCESLWGVKFLCRWTHLSPTQELRFAVHIVDNYLLNANLWLQGWGGR